MFAISGFGGFSVGGASGWESSRAENRFSVGISKSKSGCWSSLLGDEGWASSSSALKLDGF